MEERIRELEAALRSLLGKSRENDRYGYVAAGNGMDDEIRHAAWDVLEAKAGEAEEEAAP